MKYLSYVLLSVLIVSVTGLLPAAEAQSTLNFPRLFQASDLRTTGFAVANPTSTNASVTFTLLSDAGATVASSTQTVPANGQLARLGSELFGTSASGWVQATSAAPGLTGFWLSGDFATYTDGAESAPSATSMVLPLITQQTEISVANISGAANTIRLRLVGPDGIDVLPPVTQTLAAKGLFQASAGSIFPSAAFNLALYVALGSTTETPFTATSLVRSFVVQTESAVLNAVDVTTSNSTLHFAHVISGSLGGSNYTTLIGVTNLTTAAQTVTLTFNPEPSGDPIVVQRNLPAGGTLRETAQNIFSLSAGFKDGWVRVTGTQTITGFVAYGDTGSGGMAVVPPQPAPVGSMLFAHVAGLPVWYTGIALLNVGDSEASVEISVWNPDGTQVGSTVKTTLAAKHKIAKLLGELVPQAQAQNAGFVIVRSNIPLFGLQLFGGTNGNILSNIASGRPAPVPPDQAPIPTVQLDASARVGLNRIEFDTVHPRGCIASTGSCYVPQSGNRILRVRFDLFDRTTESVGTTEAIAIIQSVTVSGAGFAGKTPILLGTTGSTAAGVDTSLLISGQMVTVPAAPPYNVIYLGFEIPVNATGLKFVVNNIGVIDLGL